MFLFFNTEFYSFEMIHVSRFYELNSSSKIIIPNQATTTELWCRSPWTIYNEDIIQAYDLEFLPTIHLWNRDDYLICIKPDLAFILCISD